MKTSEVLRSAPLKTSEVLRKAADEIRRRGWYQGWFGSTMADPDNCAVCAAGALTAAELGDPFKPFTDLYFVARDQLMLAIVGNSVAEWNDEPGRTVEEVLDAFERAAEAAEIEELSSSITEKLNTMEEEDD